MPPAHGPARAPSRGGGRGPRVVADRLLGPRRTAPPGLGQVVVEPDVAGVTLLAAGGARPRPPSCSPASARAVPSRSRLDRRPGPRVGRRCARSRSAGPRRRSARSGSARRPQPVAGRRGRRHGRGDQPAAALGLSLSRASRRRRPSRPGPRPGPAATAAGRAWILAAAASAGGNAVEVEPGLAEGLGVGGVGRPSHRGRRPRPSGCRPACAGAGGPRRAGRGRRLGRPAPRRDAPAGLRCRRVAVDQPAPASSPAFAAARRPGDQVPTAAAGSAPSRVGSCKACGTRRHRRRRAAVQLHRRRRRRPAAG